MTSWLGTLLREVVGLFVDDVGLAVAIVAWLAVAWLLCHLTPVAPAWRGPVIALGLIGLFVENTLRGSRR